MRSETFSPGSRPLISPRPIRTVDCSPSAVRSCSNRIVDISVRGVRELRFSLSGNRRTRITYWFPGGRRVVLFIVFHKTQQREVDQVDRAKRARKECEARHIGPYHMVFDPTGEL